MTTVDNRQRAREWLERNGLTRNRSQWAQDRDREALTALLDSVRREAMEEAAKVCDAHARKHDLSFDAPAARALADRIRALASATTETKSHT